jgi:hypothetical protein
MTKPNMSMFPYFVQMRELERRLLRSALAQAVELGAKKKREKTHTAAALLGVAPAYLRVRAKLLGGVFDDHPVEPPITRATKLWAKENKKKPKPKEPEPNV